MKKPPQDSVAVFFCLAVLETTYYIRDPQVRNVTYFAPNETKVISIPPFPAGAM